MPTKIQIKKKLAKRKGKAKVGGVKPATMAAAPGLPRSLLISSSTTATVAKVKTKQAHTVHACSILDPFCTHAKGARRPDGMGSQSMPYQSRQIINVATNAAGAAKIWICGLNGVFGTMAGITNGANWDTPAGMTVFPGSAFIQTNAGEVRLVSMGARVMSTASATNSQGFVIMGTINNPPYSQVAQPSAIVTYAEHSLRPLTAGFESVWISKPTGANAHDFRAVSTITTSSTDFDWSTLVVEIGQGPVSTNVLMIEVICNVEFTISQATVATSGLAQLIPPSKPANRVALNAQAQVHSSMSSIMDTTVEKAGKFIESKAAGIVEDLLTGAAAFLGL